MPVAGLRLITGQINYTFSRWAEIYRLFDVAVPSGWKWET